MTTTEPSSLDWIAPTLGISLALTLAIGVGFLAGQQSLSSASDALMSCQQLPKAGYISNCIALRSTIATEAAAARAFWGNWVSFGALIGSSAALFGLIATFRQGQRSIAVAADANRIAQQNGQAQARAYVVIQSLRSKLDNRGGLTTIVEFHNSGSSPARRLRWLYNAHIHAVLDGEADRWLILGPDPDLSQSHWRQDIASADTWESHPLGIGGVANPEVVAMIQGAVFIALTVKVAVRYEDVFGVSHDEEACFQGRIIPCGHDGSFTTLQRAHDNAFEETARQESIGIS